MIINPYLVQPSGPSYGTLTTAWIAATGETDLTIIGALNTLESDLTTYGLTSKMKALYPFVGGTSGKHSYNFINTAAYQLTFNGGWTHASTGALPNGTNAYANTGLVPNGILSQNSAAIGTYLRGGTPTSINSGISIGCSGPGYNPGLYLAYAWSLGSGYDYSRNNNNTGTGVSTDNLSRGFLQNYRSNSTNMKVLKNNLTPLNNAVATSGVPNVNMYIGASNNNNVTEWYSNIEISFAFISDGYTDTDAANFYTAVQRFQTTLGRQVGAPLYDNGTLLLDTYTSSSAAYSSARKLRNNYDGYAIRVRRSSDNTEQDIPFTSLGVLDESALTTFVGAGNGFVTTWYDQSGNATNATNAAATAQPQIVSSGSLITTNGKVSLDFDGSNDRFGFTQITGVTGLTLISVNKYDTISSGPAPYEGSTTITAYSPGFDQDAGLGARVARSSFYYENNASYEILGAVNSAIINTQYLQFAYGSSSEAGQAINGALVTGTAARNDLIVKGIANDNTILTHAYYDGTIQEAIIYTTNRASDRAGIQTNINTFYSIY